MSQLTNLQRIMSKEDLPSASISLAETKLVALVIAHAILNPYVTEWDIDRCAEPMPHAVDKTKYFQHPQWGHISDPATVLDIHGRVMVWYLLGILPPQRVEHLNRIHLPLKGSLVKHSKRKNESSKKFGHRHVPELDGSEEDPLADAMFGHGRLMNSPATFQQGHVRLLDRVYESSNLKIPAVQEWLHDISYAEEFWNSISGLVLPDLARVGRDAIAAKEDWVVTQPLSGTPRPSIYVSIDVIVNQETPAHLDKVSVPSLLVPSLLKKYKTSNKCLEDMNQAYDQLTAVLDPNKVAQWELDALKAETDHGEGDKGEGGWLSQEASEPSKNWVLKGEQTLTDYLLTDPVEEELNEEKKDAEITLDDDGNPEVPPWTGQKPNIQQNLARTVFQAAYGVFFTDMSVSSS
ncbi:hypothetical protein PISMIDRAFT_17847 [Pisolithus microcarpus 441]|uniref:Uncharacterized protein n=1 Tax=Pisolithus microcarpus 441 TaxID=765257 RepID=A0A0C9XMN3_9AGAM|nr:hypothetical protein BKA83DRAFT_17847 [Pisolithus microcarpus]KIK13645.1 hypothetical protein PISMIDRAFT_17847 [Pisolithus microcarpus 441]